MTIRPPAHLAPYVEILGENRAIVFLLTFGGGNVYLSGRQADSRIRTVLDEPTIARLREEFGHRIDRVPVGKTWIAQVWAERDVSVLEIARRLHTTDKTVRVWLKDGKVRPSVAAREAKRETRLAEKAKQIDLEDWLSSGFGRTRV